MKSKIISILALLLTVTQGAWAQTNNYEPLGSFWGSQGSADWLSFTPINGAIFIAGWAADQDYPGQSTHVDWYVWNNYSDAQTPNWNSHVNHGGIDPDIYADYSSIIGEWCKGNIVFNRYIRMDQGTYYFRAWSIDYTSAGVRAQYPKNHEMGNSYSGNIVNTVIVYAPYTVTLDRQSGTGGSASVSNVCTGFDMPSITVPTREGYTFGGYYSETGGNGTKYYNADGTSARYWNQASESATATLYAKWTQNTATLTDGDDLSALSTYAGKTCTVTYTRSFTADKPSTVCLPFAYTPKSGETFYTFTGINEDGGNYTADMTEVVSPLVANTPYLFMPAGDADFSGTYAIPDPLTAGTTTPDGSDWTFVGTFETIEWTTAPTTPTYGFSAQDANDGIKQGQFVKVGSYVRIKPMRAYLQYNGSDSQFINARALTRAAATTSDDTLPETIGVRLISANGEVTAIGTISTTTGEMTMDGAWYSINGTRLNDTPATKGIYVRNGKKVVVK